jgi:GntR family transcriptional repressor for pyruvate dehydrogenase complex
LNQLQHILDQISLRIAQGDWPVDSRLPSERALSVEYGVSRATIREVITALKQKGYIHSVTGSGHYVQSTEAVQSAAFISWQNQTFSHNELREYRMAIESQSAYLAALRADQAQLKVLERAHQHLKHVNKQGDIKAEGLADARFHLAIAEASGNQILAQTLKGLFALLRANVTRNIGTLSRRPETRLRLMKQHTALFEAIYNGKAERAREIAQEHMAFVDRVLQDRA